jgi:mannitol 2-dehydrogenase
VIAYISGLLDIHFVHEAMENPLVKAYLAKVEKDEIMPCVPPVPNTDLDDYMKLVERRFANPKIADTVRRLCLDGSNRQPKFIVPSIADRLKAGKGIKGLALESALWCRYCAGTTDSGAVIEDNDPNWTRLQKTALAAKADPDQWLAMADIYGEVGKSPVMREEFAAALNSLWKVGAKVTVEEYLK